MYKFGVFFLLCLTACLSARALAPSAECAILIDANSGNCLYAKNADEQHGMASTTKIMTALLAIERGDLDTKIQIDDAAIGIEGSSLYLQKGERLSMRELLYGLMLRSANDAATAIATACAGSVDAFAEAMNQKAETLGLRNTHFTNPHGLADENHYTTARDLANLTAFALKNETFREICSTKKASIGETRLVVNHNKLLFTYDGACGVKTGFTKATGRCLVSAAERDGVQLVAVTLHATDDWNDHTAMLDYGFSAYESVTLSVKGDFVTRVSLCGGVADTVEAVIGESVSVCLPKERGSIVERVEISSPKFAPIYKGDLMGKILYLLDGNIIASVPLYAKEYVSAMPIKNTFFNKFILIFK